MAAQVKLTKTGSNKKRLFRSRANANGKVLSTQQSVNQAIKTICDVMRRSNCAGALQYVPELTWILFLRILDEREQREAAEQEMLGLSFATSISSPFRWRDWAAPYDEISVDTEGNVQGWKRKELQSGELNRVIAFVNGELLPYLKDLRNKPNATSRQKVVSEVLSGVEKTRIDTDYNFLEILTKVHDISESAIDTTHVFPLSQVFEGLLLRMGEKGNDGGQFFTPREVIRAMVRVVDPQIGETVYDPACGTGGFLAQSYEHMIGPNKCNLRTGDDIATLKQSTFYGREKDNAIYPIGLANLVLHDIDEPHICHGNTLTNLTLYDGLFLNPPPLHDVVLMNPPFGGKEGKDAQKNFEYQTGATQVLFLQHVIKSLKPNGGRCGMVIDEGVLFRTNESAFVKTKKKLLDECDLYCIVSLPGGVFTQAGAGVKTNLLFFTKGQKTEKIWYYDLSDIKVGKKSPLTLNNFTEFFSLLPERADSERSWTVDIIARKKDAKRQSDPLRAEADRISSEATELRNHIKQLQAANGSPEPLEELQKSLSTLETKIRGFNSKAQSIDDAVYDLKAVNPKKKSNEDTRTPQQLLDFIESKGREIQAAIDALRLFTTDDVTRSDDTNTSELNFSRTDTKHEEHQRDGIAERMGF
jgi:type I restriction enzyme M protein